MSNRTLNRSAAKALYAKFSHAWRDEKRLSGQYGKPGARKPTFNQWYKMHQRDIGMMAESTPTDVQEYLGLDPWEQSEPVPVEVPIVDEPRRGVETINIAGDDE